MITKVKNLIKSTLKFYKDELDLAFSDEPEFGFLHKLFVIFILFIMIPFMGFLFIGSIAFIVYSIPWIVLSALVIFGMLVTVTLIIDKHYKKEENNFPE